jgi:hypothetical protein
MVALRNRRLVVVLFVLWLSVLCAACSKAPETAEQTPETPAVEAPAPVPVQPPICKQSITDCNNQDQCASAPITAAASVIPTAPRCIPHGEGGNPAQQYIDAYSWNMFLALNWPANTSACDADQTKSIVNVQSGDGTYVVWQTYMPGERVFVNPGFEKPASWCSGNGLSAGANRLFDKEAKAVAEAMKLGGPFLKIAEPGQDVLQAAGGVVTDQNQRWLRYERLMNKVEYDYITDGRWNMPLLQALETPIAIPEQSIELKASWKILTPTEIASKTYFTTQGMVCNTPDGQKLSPCDDEPVTFGLVGLHIVQQLNTGGNMFWATFEQKANDQVFATPGGSTPPNKDLATQPYVELDASCKGLNTPTNIQRETPIPSDPTINAYYQELLSGSVFSNYRLVSTQWTAGTDLRGTPPDVANITLETYVQKLATPIKGGAATGCMACHLNATTPVQGQSSNHSFFFLEAKYATMPPKK